MSSVLMHIVHRNDLTASVHPSMDKNNIIKQHRTIDVILIFIQKLKNQNPFKIHSTTGYSKTPQDTEIVEIYQLFKTQYIDRYAIISCVLNKKQFRYAEG